jgi:hypothetical protein
MVPAETSRHELRALIQNMLDETPAGYVLRISRCDHLKQPVIAPWDARYKLDGIPAHSLVQSRDTLFISPEFFPLDSLADRLWEEFGDAVSDGRFSIPASSRHYCSLTQDDIATIQESQRHEFDEDA